MNNPLSRLRAAKVETFLYYPNQFHLFTTTKALITYLSAQKNQKLYKRGQPGEIKEVVKR
jgi:hypothetical protein